MDSAGVWELASAYMPAKSKGGELKFLYPTKDVHRVLQITQAGQSFGPHETKIRLKENNTSQKNLF
jgi:anti-anti-sigma regulatory factor